MTEYNLFCYSKNYNDENSFQQDRYRAFNTKVDEKIYRSTLSKCKEILGKKDLSLNDFWEQVSQEQWNKLMKLAAEVRGDSFKDGFEYISGVKIKEDTLVGSEVEVKVNGKTYKAVIKESER
jgi:hypothetical protein